MEQKKKPRAIELVQPNRVTNARYDFSAAQENVLTLMIDAIQKHMTKEKPIQTDLFGEPIIVVDTKELGANNKSYYWREIDEMRKKDFEFDWVRPTDNKHIKTRGSIITTIHNVRETTLIEVTINKWAIPYLLYWGKGVGGTIFNKVTALTVKGVYAKRLYKLCKRWEDQGGFSMPLDELRAMLGIEGRYKTIGNLKLRVLDAAAKELKERADVYFSYSLDKVGGSRSYNFIHIAIHANDKNRATGKKSDMYVFVYNMLTLAYPVIKSSAARDIADHISLNNEAFERLYYRLKELKKELDTGEKEVVDVVRLIKYIIKNDYGLI